MILGSDELSRSLRFLVEDQHGEVMARLEELDRVLSDVASHIAGFERFANAVRVNSGLSDQAVSILCQLNTRGVAEFIESVAMRGAHENQFKYFSPERGQLEIAEPRFLDDDLRALVELGLLSVRQGCQNERIFTITRAGAAVGRQEGHPVN